MELHLLPHLSLYSDRRSSRSGRQKMNELMGLKLLLLVEVGQEPWHTRESEDNLVKLILSFPLYMGSRDGTQVSILVAFFF